MHNRSFKALSKRDGSRERSNPRDFSKENHNNQNKKVKSKSKFK